ncbi:MAG: hypothetical protein KA163_12280 [Bacteroidia bacterium]|nr:hypothetical protein [Bacteroidia bacterium]
MEKIDEKTYQYLLHYYDNPGNELFVNFIRHSEIFIRNGFLGRTSEMIFYLDPELYKKLGNQVESIKKIIANTIHKISDYNSMMIYVKPDLGKFQILKNNYTTVLTPWENINNSQNHLLNLLRTAQNTVDFQNIGNTSRTLLQNISNIVFDSTKHIPEDKTIDVSEGKFKNRLHTYIKHELSGQENKELRDFAVSIITTAEKSIDLANKLTHDLKANSMLAEACVISTIAAIGIVRLIK